MNKDAFIAALFWGGSEGGGGEINYISVNYTISTSYIVEVSVE